MIIILWSLKTVWWSPHGWTRLKSNIFNVTPLLIDVGPLLESLILSLCRFLMFYFHFHVHSLNAVLFFFNQSSLIPSYSSFLDTDSFLSGERTKPWQSSYSLLSLMRCLIDWLPLICSTLSANFKAGYLQSSESGKEN